MLCNDSFAVSGLQVEPSFSNSDHNAISFDLFYTDLIGTSKRPDIKKFNFKKANWENIMLQVSSLDWNELFSNLQYDQLWDVFISEMFSIIERCVPLISNGESKRKPVYPKNIRKLQIRKHAVWKTWQKTKDDRNKMKYLEISRECRRAIYVHVTNKERLLLEANNLGRFYKYVNRKLSTKTGIGVLKDNNGENVYDPASQANVFSDFFSSTFVTDDGVLPNFPSRVPSDTSLSYIPFNKDSVLQALKKLRPDTAGGPDGLQPCFLKRVSQYIAYPLSIMFESFFLNTYVPPIWRKAYVRPVIKSGSASFTSNYRPISLTCTCSKLMESIISKHMMEYLLDNELISKHQHGFISKRSSCSQLLESFPRLDFRIVSQERC